jgi:hypothetical protein
MKRRKIRCFTGFAEAGGVYNIKVHYLSYEGWSNFRLVSCINCGELFVIDYENPKTAGLSIGEIAGQKFCPNCGCKLCEHLHEYPKCFRTRTGIMGSFEPPKYIPPDVESSILEVWELIPD